MPRLDESRGIAIVPMGCFDEDPGFRPERHIFVASKIAWDERSSATCSKPCFNRAPPSTA